MKHTFVKTRFISSLFLLALSFTLSLKAQDTIPTVKIGNQIWMVKNLDVVTFRNGDTIPEAKSDSAWQKASIEGTAAWCYYNNDLENGKKYGKLYNWHAVNDPRGLAPKGYHVPSKTEYDSLVFYLGGKEIAGKKLRSSEGWQKAGNGTNESNFSGLPGGLREGFGGYFRLFGVGGCWWSATKNVASYSCFILFCFDDPIEESDRSNGGIGMSVRCLRD